MPRVKPIATLDLETNLYSGLDPQREQKVFRHRLHVEKRQALQDFLEERQETIDHIFYMQCLDNVYPHTDRWGAYRNVLIDFKGLYHLYVTYVCTPNCHPYIEVRTGLMTEEHSIIELSDTKFNPKMWKEYGKKIKENKYIKAITFEADAGGTGTGPRQRRKRHPHAPEYLKGSEEVRRSHLECLYAFFEEVCSSASIQFASLQLDWWPIFLFQTFKKLWDSPNFRYLQLKRSRNGTAMIDNFMSIPDKKGSLCYALRDVQLKSISIEDLVVSPTCKEQIILCCQSVDHIYTRDLNSDFGYGSTDGTYICHLQSMLKNTDSKKVLNILKDKAPPLTPNFQWSKAAILDEQRHEQERRRLSGNDTHEDFRRFWRDSMKVMDNPSERNCHEVMFTYHTNRSFGVLPSLSVSTSDGVRDVVRHHDYEFNIFAWSETVRSICKNSTVKSIHFRWDRMSFESGLGYAAEENCLRSIFHEISLGIHIEAIDIDIKFLPYFDINDMRKLFSRARLKHNMAHVDGALNFVQLTDRPLDIGGSLHYDKIAMRVMSESLQGMMLPNLNLDGYLFSDKYSATEVLDACDSINSLKVWCYDYFNYSTLAKYVRKNSVLKRLCVDTPTIHHRVGEPDMSGLQIRGMKLLLNGLSTNTSIQILELRCTDTRQGGLFSYRDLTEMMCNVTECKDSIVDCSNHTIKQIECHPEPNTSDRLEYCHFLEMIQINNTPGVNKVIRQKLMRYFFNVPGKTSLDHLWSSMPLNVLVTIMAIDVHQEYKRNAMYSILRSVPELVVGRLSSDTYTDISNEPAVTSEFEEGIIVKHDQLGVCNKKRKSVGDDDKNKASKEQKK